MSCSFFGIMLTALRSHAAVYDKIENCDKDMHYFFSGYLAQLQATNQIMLTAIHLNSKTDKKTPCLLLRVAEIFRWNITMESRFRLIRQPCSTLCQHRGFQTSLCSFLLLWFFLSEISRRRAVRSGVFGLNIILLYDGDVAFMFLWRICNYTMII